MSEKDATPNDTKRIVVQQNTKRHANLKIKLKYENLSMKDFVRAIVDGLADGDRRILDYLEDWKVKNKKQGRSRTKKYRAELAHADNIEYEFGLDEDDIASIFDILERENGDI